MHFIYTTIKLKQYNYLLLSLTFNVVKGHAHGQILNPCIFQFFIKCVVKIIVLSLGTKNVIEACVQRGVKSLIYTGTRDVMVGDWDLDNIDETVPTPAIQNHAYPRTKLKAEQAVLGANGRALQTGKYYAHTYISSQYFRFPCLWTAHW